MIPTPDLDAAVTKSDTVISSGLKTSLRAAVAPLEYVSNRLKDWHPGSDGKVLDLLYPSLFPLLHGRSRILPSGVVEPQNCESIGKGELISCRMIYKSILTGFMLCMISTSEVLVQSFLVASLWRRICWERC